MIFFREVMMDETILVGLENLFLALSDKTRLRLLSLMVDGEVPVGFLVDNLGESQPKISRHLAYLRSAGLVSTRRDGKWIYYGIEGDNDPAVTRVLNATLRSISLGGVASGQPVRSRDDSYVPHDPSADVQEYSDDWSPAEMDIFLL